MNDLARLLKLYRPYAGWMLAGTAASAAVVLANVGLLALAGWFIAAMALAGLRHGLIEFFAPAAAIRALAILRTGGRYGERLVTHEATLRLLARLRVWFFAALEPLAPARLQLHRGGDLLSRIRADIDSLDGFYLRVVSPAAAAALGVAAICAFLAWYAPSLALLDGAALAGAGILLPAAAQRLGRANGRRAVELRSDLRAAAADTVRGLGELLVFGAAARQTALVSRLGADLVAVRRRQTWRDALAAMLSALVKDGATWGALVLLIPLVAAKRLPAPDLPMLALLTLAGFEAVAPLPLAFASLGETLAAARRLFELADAEPPVAEPPVAGLPEQPRLPARLGVQVEGLRMRYAAGAAWALDGANLAVPAGGSVALVGASGSGKTSLINVLLRFWDYQAGRVEIGGVPLRRLRGDAVRGICAVVAQQTHLFNASIRDNLLLACPATTDADLRAALAAVDLLAEVEAMPAGLDTFVGEMGLRLSGGQARRLAVARAALKDAPILLLDEPTEGLDAASEAKVLAALSQLMRGRTTILVTHRRQALALVDTVVTLHRGRTVDGLGREDAARPRDTFDKHKDMFM